MSTEELIQKIAKGDERALDRFMDIWTERLVKYSFCITGSKEISEEVVSDVFFDMWRAKGKLLEIVNIDSWLRVVTLKKSLSAIRGMAEKSVSVSFDDIDDFTIAPVNAPDEDILLVEKFRSLDKAIESLPPKCRHVFYLAKIDEIPYKEISQMLSVSVATINYHIAYAMNHLKSILKGRELVLLLAYAGYRLLLCL